VPIERANGIEVFDERLGSGPPLLWLNGSGSTEAPAVIDFLLEDG
jgi:hypothetical protein